MLRIEAASSAVDLDCLFFWKESTLVEIHGSLRTVLRHQRIRVKEKRQRLSSHVVARRHRDALWEDMFEKEEAPAPKLT